MRLKNHMSVPALERGLLILEWISLQSEPVTLTQIAVGVNLSVSESQRPVSCLLQSGYLTRTLAGAYSLSGKLYRLAHYYPPYHGLHQVAVPLMRDFSRQQGESVHLCVPDGDAVLILADSPGGDLVRISLQEGTRIPPLSTVSGRVLLAFHAIKTKHLTASLKKSLQTIRYQGYEEHESAHSAGIIDIGVPVQDQTGRTVAALTTSMLKLRNRGKSTAAVVSALKGCSSVISTFL